MARFFLYFGAVFWLSVMIAMPARAAKKKVVVKHPEGCDIKGNLGGRKRRIYHVPGMRFYKRTKINKKGERWFCSEKQAQEAGWRKAGKFKRPVRDEKDCALPKGREATDPLIKGNITKQGKLYHLKCSGLYAETIIDETSGEKWFMTEEEAHEAGFFKSGKLWSGPNHQDFRDCILADNTPSGRTIKGNISKNGQIYHIRGSKHYAETSIRPRRGERWFATVEEAMKAGWRAPRDKNPRPDNYCETMAVVGLGLRGSITDGADE